MTPWSRLAGWLGFRPQTTWKRGERAAERYLRRLGYRTVGRNVRTKAGEADLVMLSPDRATVVLVEVKAREGVQGPERRPEASITTEKRRRLLGIGRVLAARRVWRGRSIRIDVVAVEFGPRGATIRHHENAV